VYSSTTAPSAAPAFTRSSAFFALDFEEKLSPAGLIARADRELSDSRHGTPNGRSAPVDHTIADGAR